MEIMLYIVIGIGGLIALFVAFKIIKALISVIRGMFFVGSAVSAVTERRQQKKKVRNETSALTDAERSNREGKIKWLVNYHKYYSDYLETQEYSDLMALENQEKFEKGNAMPSAQKEADIKQIEEKRAKEKEEAAARKKIEEELRHAEYEKQAAERRADGDRKYERHRASTAKKEAELKEERSKRNAAKKEQFKQDATNFAARFIIGAAEEAGKIRKEEKRKKYFFFITYKGESNS